MITLLPLSSWPINRNRLIVDFWCLESSLVHWNMRFLRIIHPPLNIECRIFMVLHFINR